ncbi:Rv2175c family DNA-binding protein [Actinomycetes bacterium KLBMP 9759]
MLPLTHSPVASCPPVNDVFVVSDDVATMPVAEVAQLLAIPVTRVHQLVRDGQLLSFRRDGAAVVPAAFLDGDTVVKGLPGTITVLRDGGYSDTDILRWLFAEDDSLPGTPVASLRAGRHREVKRRAQAMAF